MNLSIFEHSKKGRTGYLFDTYTLSGQTDAYPLEEDISRTVDPRLPEVSENHVVRHFTNLSSKNFGVDTGMYPLGSCTMKYNPKINEVAAAMPAFSNAHPSVDPKHVQGCLHIAFELQEMLKTLTGMAAMTLQPAAGSQGELTGLMMIKQYHLDHGNTNKKHIIIPDSAHGTNPASVTMAGYKTIEVASNSEGTIDLDALKAAVNDETAGLMLTNPNTLGLFEKDIVQIAEIIHGVGGLLYYDGANMNANMGITRPAEMGFDIVHLNLHKTLSTPHGGGGPGSGPVGVCEALADYLPGPVIAKSADGYKPVTPVRSIGQVKAYYGNFAVYLRAYVYMLSMGGSGLKFASEMAVLNANYMKEQLKEKYCLPYDRICKHEFVLSGLKDPNGCTTLDVAKRLIDLKLHPPTIYFPLIVEQALMFEPTESESLETIDHYVDALLRIAEEASATPDALHMAPTKAPVRRLDEVAVARHPVLKYQFEEA